MLPPEVADGLVKELERLGLPTGLLPRLETYAAELIKHNKRYGLVQDDAPEEIAGHLLDSLAPWPFLEQELRGKVVDLGSGAGLPGIPLALAAQASDIAVSWVLAERMQKRARFLSGTAARLGLIHVKVFSDDAIFLGTVADVAVCRAFMPLGQALLDLASKVLTPDGTLIYYAGRRAEAENGLPEIYRSRVTWHKIENSTKERWVALIPIRKGL